jgi:hypothetical protein
LEQVRRTAGKTITVSFWAFSPTSIKLGVSWTQSFGSGGTPSANIHGVGQVINLTPGWVRYSVTFTVPSVNGITFGTNGGTDFFQLELWATAGSNYATNSGIGVQSGTIGFWGVQLEIGNTMTPLEKIDPTDELTHCQRFYQTITMKLLAYVLSGNVFGYATTWPTRMRAIPSTLISGQLYGTASGLTADAVNTAIMTVIATASATGMCYFQCDIAASADL